MIALKVENIDINSVEFIKYINFSIVEAMHVERKLIDLGASQYVVNAAKRTISRLKALKLNVETNKLPRPSAGQVPRGLGLVSQEELVNGQRMLI